MFDFFREMIDEVNGVEFKKEIKKKKDSFLPLYLKIGILIYQILVTILGFNFIINADKTLNYIMLGEYIFEIILTIFIFFLLFSSKKIKNIIAISLLILLGIAFYLKLQIML